MAGGILSGARNKVYFAPVTPTKSLLKPPTPAATTFGTGATCVAPHGCEGDRSKEMREREKVTKRNKTRRNGTWKDRWLKRRRKEERGGRERGCTEQDPRERSGPREERM